MKKNVTLDEFARDFKKLTSPEEFKKQVDSFFETKLKELERKSSAIASKYNDPNVREMALEWSGAWRIESSKGDVTIGNKSTFSHLFEFGSTYYNIAPTYLLTKVKKDIEMWEKELEQQAQQV